jgi:hypothetical protein
MSIMLIYFFYFLCVGAAQEELERLEAEEAALLAEEGMYLQLRMYYSCRYSKNNIL